MASDRNWTFFKAGGVEQVMLETGSDIVHIGDLDQKLWVALTCPTQGVSFDTRTLSLLDTDQDGFVRPPELIAAASWMGTRLSDVEVLVKPGSGLPLSAINTRDDEGKRLAATATAMLVGISKPGTTVLSIDDLMAADAAWANSRLNGDGIVLAEHVDEPAAKQVATELVDCLGGELDLSGKAGVSQAKIDAFKVDLTAYDAWITAGDAPGVKPLGEATAGAVTQVDAIAAKVEDFFARCRLAEFDPRAGALVNRTEADLSAIVSHDINRSSAQIADLPLARAEAGRTLPLLSGVNPAWADAMVKFHAEVVSPLLGADKTRLNEEEWAHVQARLAPFRAWSAAKAGAAVEKLGQARARAILAGTELTTLSRLVAEDKAYEEELKSRGDVEKLVRYQQNLARLMNNYVSFADFYRQKGAIFQAGTLFVDGRTCDLCVEVADAGAHSGMAALAGAYLAYCKLSGPGGASKTVVAVVSNGDGDNLMVGRNGVFYTRDGAVWGATIVKVISNPISVAEAFWSPYKKFFAFVEEQVASRASAADAEANSKVTSAATEVANADKTDPNAKPEEKAGMDVGTVAAIGVALGSIATFAGMMIAKFLDLGMWMPVGILGVVLLISGPSMLLAWLKLRNRNLAPILDGCGWAINTQAVINIPLGTALTTMADLPEGSKVLAGDPFEEKKRPWKFYLTVILLVVLGYSWSLGSLDTYLPDPAKKATIMPSPAPAPAAPAAPEAAPAVAPAP